jgi:hypothetical protein
MSSVTKEVLEPVLTLQKSNQNSFWGQVSTNLITKGFLMSGLFLFSFVLGVWPVNQTVILIPAGLAIGLFISWIFEKFSILVTTNGGLYFFLRCVWGKVPAFILSTLWLGIASFFAGYLLIILPRYLIPEYLKIAGTGFANQTVLNFISQIKDPVNIVAYGLVLILLGFLLSTSLNKAYTFIINLALVLMIILAGLILFQVIVPFYTFETAWNQLLGVNIFADVVMRSEIFQIGRFNFNGIFQFASLAVFVWLFTYGVENLIIPKQLNQKPSVWAHWLPGIFSAVFIVLFLFMISRFLPEKWLTAQSYLALLGEGTVGPSTSLFTTYAGIMRPDISIFGIIVLGWIVFNLGYLRSIFSMGALLFASFASDNIIHPIFLQRNIRTNQTPMGILVTAIVVIVGFISGLYSLNIVDLIGFILMQLLVILFILAAMTFGNKWQSLINESTPRIFSQRIGKFPVLSLFSGIAFVVMAGLIVLLVITPTPYGFTPWLGIVVTALILILTGIYSLAYRRKFK